MREGGRGRVERNRCGIGAMCEGGVYVRHKEK